MSSGRPKSYKTRSKERKNKFCLTVLLNVNKCYMNTWIIPEIAHSYQDQFFSRNGVVHIWNTYIF